MKNPLKPAARMTRIFAQCKEVAEKLRSEGRTTEAHMLESAGAKVDVTVKALATKGQAIYTLASYRYAVELYKRYEGRYPEGSKYLNLVTGDLEEYRNG